MEIGIRKFRPTDAEALLTAVRESMKTISPWLSWCTPQYSLDDASDWATSAELVWQQGRDYRFVIEDISTDAFLGTVGISQINKEHKAGNLGYWVRKSACGKGVCVIGAREAVKKGFTELGLERIEIFVHSDNAASNAVAQKLGGEFEGALRNKFVFFGALSTANCYSIIPSDYGL